MNLVAFGPFGGPVVYEHLWAHLRHGLAVVGWVLLTGLVAAATCWCCGYVGRGDLRRSASACRGGGERGGGERGAGERTIVLDDAAVAAEAERGIRDIERYLSAV